MSNGKPKAAEAIFVGGNIITVDDRNPGAEALAVTDGRIAAVGALDHVLRHRGPRTETIPLDGKTLMPGLVEPHSHPVVSAMLYDWVDLSGFTNRSGAEVMQRLYDAAAEAKPGQWIAGFGYDPILVRDLKALSADALDEISSTNPVFVMIQSMHTVYVNHKALEVAGIDDDSRAPEGGIYVRDAAGKLTGMLIEQAAISSVMIPLAMELQASGAELIGKQLRRYASAGYTSVGAMGVFPVFLDWARILSEQLESDDCPLRMTVMEKVTDMEQGLALPCDNPSARYSIGGAKLWYDGSFGTGNVYLHRPFVDSPLMLEGLGVAPGSCGAPMFPKQRLVELIRKYHAQGRQIAVHAQGDRAIGDVVDAFATVLAESPRDDHRHRIEHGGLFPIEEMERAASLGLSASWHANYIYYYGDAMRDEIVGPERARNSFPAGAAVRAGLRSSLHNDSPMYPAEPLRLMRSAVTRKTRSGKVLGPEQALSIDEAIRAVTIDAAWQLFLDDEIGSLEVGKYADLAVLSRDPRAVDPDRLEEIEVVATYREGRRFAAPAS